MKKLIKSCAVTFLSALFVANTVQAGTLMTYNGSGIRGKSSIQSWSTNGGRYYVNHNQSPSPGSGNVGFKVSVVSRGWIGGTTYSSSIFYGQTGGTFSTDVPAGTYGLYFNTIDRGSYDIWGSVTD